ncbi:MAG: AMP-binding protein [Rhodocyclaceae bacterium]|nr:AMP-binding protein [Rhodocyclaceae bacterium]
MSAAANTVRALLERAAAADPDGDFAVAPETGRRLSFAELHRASRALAAFFDAHGIAPGRHVALLLPNGLQAVRLFVGTMAAGRVVVPLSLLAQPAQLRYVIEHSDAVAAFVAPAYAARLDAALAGLARPVAAFVVDPDAADMPGEPDAPAWPSLPPTPDDPALLMYTSGTTGRPKGVLLTHGNVAAGARSVGEAHELGAADRVLAVLPLYHINAQIVTVLAPLAHGGSLIMPRRFSVGDFWQLAEAFRCTWLNVVPTIVAYLLNDAATAPRRGALPALRFCRSASAPLPPEQHRAFEARFGIGIVETLGLTETAAPILANPADVERRRIGSPGKASGCETRIVDPANGRAVEDGRVGEIVVRGNNVMRGYYKAPEESAAAFTADGWLRTGDLGYRDADGFHFVTGRLKELIIKGGENIAPREIDEALLQHPAVLEAAAVGVPDANYGQEILAGVVLRPGADCDEAALRAFCRERLGAFKTPRYLHFLPELPKGPSGKVQRLRLLDCQ